MTKSEGLTRDQGDGTPGSEVETPFELRASGFVIPAKPAVFLDRDGVLNPSVVRDGRPFPPATVADFVLYPDAAPSCARLAAAGFVLVVVTNQPDLGRGTQSLAAVEAMHARLLAAIPEIARVEVCPHGGADHGQPCECRKPQPGMLRRAAAVLGLDLSRSWMVGDRWRDVDAGRAAGCRTVFIERGYDEPLRELPDARVGSLAEAADVILHPGSSDANPSPSSGTNR